MVAIIIILDFRLGKKYAQILGYNYNTGEWFQIIYKIFNKDL